MRLRYLRVRNNPPLDDVAITFHHEETLGRACAIHFVVGVNGSGKSRLLQVLAEVFLELSRQSVPAYPVSLAYDLGIETSRRTIYLHHEGGGLSNAVLIEYDRELGDVDWESLLGRSENERIRFRGRELPGSASIGAYLPSVLLAYTSGSPDTWESLFRTRGTLDDEAIAAALEDPDVEERPASWDTAKESEIVRREGLTAEPNDAEASPSIAGSPGALPSDSVLFVSAAELKLALCAVSLDHAVNEFRDRTATEESEKAFVEAIERSISEDRRMPGLRGILNAVDWLWPVTISLSLNRTQKDFTHGRMDQATRYKLDNLLQNTATSNLRAPESWTRRLFFDLRRPLPDRASKDPSTGAALMEVLGGEDATPFDVFRTLQAWRREGLLEDIGIVLRKRNAEDLLLYDWLSDGERVFLGRMALFHLLRGKDGEGRDGALLLLDEPETHFNDVWKREIVDIIDESLGNVMSNVVITTHSSIALTDVFDTEISLLKKDPIDGTIAVQEDLIQSFGASPTEIMRDIFGAHDTVGQRATQFLDLVLTVAAHPEQVESVWRTIDEETATRSSTAFQELWALVNQPHHHYENDSRLLNALRAVRDYARTQKNKIDIGVTDALEVLESRLGPGAYQFEFQRRLLALRKRDPNAPSN
jgi:energy-coupling factor transporter ATP-binding protein EcfA2